MKISDLTIVTVVAWLLVLNVSLMDTQTKLSELEENQTLVQAELVQLQDKLDSSISSIAELESQLSSLGLVVNSTLVEQRQELQALQTEFGSLETQLTSYFDWFEQNSDLGPIESEQLHTIEDCVLANIRLPCVWFRNEKVFDIDYLDDISLGKQDFIQNVSFTIDRSGGDCEDLATLFMAEANYLMDKYDRPFEAWKASTAGQYEVIGSWYMEDAELVEIAGDQVYMVCYSQGPSGHCINAICEQDIMIEAGLDERLANCTLIEPQEYAEVIWTAGNSIGNDFSRAPFYGWIIAMSSDNLCMREETGWVCFDKLQQDLQAKLDELKTFK
ncbi:MAG: hypothetical protein GOU99_02190 [Candidatus Altiarchaeota archaeon]|nr:hypothetical protein [Candidatus Altiarchaeota archaeon]